MTGYMGVCVPTFKLAIAILTLRADVERAEHRSRHEGLSGYHF